jgi:tRNA A-37 threonylcarbamoyl transferase component Bud32
MNEPGLSSGDHSGSAGNAPDAPTIGHSPSAETAATLVGLLDRYMADLQAGKSPDRGQLLAEHPELAEQLEACLAGIDFIHRAASPESTQDQPALLGDFRIVAEVGRGGMGVVYEAEQCSLKRKVALKVLRFGVVADEDAMQRFRREAETVARLHHTNIVPIFAIGSDRGVQYYAMQFIEGRSLAAVADGAANQGRLLDPDTIAKWGLQAAEALAHAHQRGIIHRDIKPSNLLLDPEGVVWLTDFGLAKRADEVTLTASGALMGTPRYMSPEQAEALKRTVDHRTDLYSLGASLYELATGKPVFDSATPLGVIAQILANEPVPPRQARPDLPRDLETIIQTCLAKDPARRYTSAQALADDLRAFLDGRPIKARRASIAERAVRAVRKQKRSVAVAAVATVLSALGITGAIVGWTAYQESKLGRVQLVTQDASPLTAEILRADRDELVLPPFTVPARTPVALPEGSYRARLSAKGKLSETYDFAVVRGEDRNYSVGLSRGDVGSPVEIPESFSMEPVLFGQREDMVEWSIEKVRRRDAITSMVVWEIAINGDQAPKEGDLSERLTILSGSATLVQPAPDLNQDGTPDLVWASRSSPSLLAVSGKDGSVLWWHRARPAGTGAPAGRGATAGDAVIGDADGDGVEDFFASFTAVREGVRINAQSPPGQTDSYIWVEAVSGRDGHCIWTRETTVPPHEGLERGVVQYTIWGPRIIKLKGQSVVAVTAGTRWEGFNPKSGEPIGPWIKLVPDVAETKTNAYVPVRPTQYADTNGDGEPEAIVVGDVAGAGGELICALTLPSGQMLWAEHVESQFRGDTRSGLPITEVSLHSDWPVIADLDRDGAAELIVPDQWPAPGAGPKVMKKGLRILDGRTGSTRWFKILRIDNDWTEVDRFSVGPDVDGDGFDDLFVISFLPYVRGDGLGDDANTARLFVDALSGKSGRGLWWWGKAVGWNEELIDTPLWWEADRDGIPKLVVTHGSPFSGGQPTNTYLLAAGTGRLASAISGFRARGIANLDNDGLADLWGTEKSTEISGPRTLRIFRGEAPIAWRRMEKYSPVLDLNGDEISDLLGTPQGSSPEVTAISGEDGQVLWRTNVNPSPGEDSPRHNYSLFSVAGPLGDLNGDGLNDLVAFQARFNDPNNGCVSRLPLVAVSGKTGKRIWTAGAVPEATGLVHHAFRGLQGAKMGSGENASLFVLHELTTGYTITAGFELRIARILARTGRVLYDTKVLDAKGAFDLKSGATYPMSVVDLTGDGVEEILLQVPVADASAPGFIATKLIAVSLTDGHVLWANRVLRSQGPGGSFDAGIPVFDAADLDGDHRVEVVVVDIQKPNVMIRALNGADGSPRWVWRGTDNSDVPIRSCSAPPLLPDLNGDRHRQIFCKIERADGKRECILLDAKGQIVERRPVQSEQLKCTADDLDGDGKTELMFEESNHCTVATKGGLNQVLWTAPRSLGIVQSGAHEKIATVIAQSIGLDGATGKPRFMAGPGGTDAYLRTSSLPRPLGHVGDETICRMPVKTSPDGAPSPAGVLTRVYPDCSDDPRDHWPRFPWSPARGEPGLAWLPLIAMAEGLFAALVFGAPWLAMRRTLRGQQWHAWHLALAVVWCALVLAFSRTIMAYFPKAPSDPWFLPIGILAAFMVGGIPIMVLFVWLAPRVLAGRWRALALATLIALVSMGAMIVLVLMFARPLNTPSKRGVWDGWLNLATIGAWWTGVVLMFSAIMRTLIRLVARVFRRRAPLKATAQ